MTRPIPWRRDLSAPFHLLQSELNRLMEEYWNPARLGPSQSPPMDLERAVRRVKALFESEQAAAALRTAVGSAREHLDEKAFGEPVQPARKARTGVG